MSTIVTKIETESTEVGGLVATIEVERTGPNMILLSTAPSADDLPVDVAEGLFRWLLERRDFTDRHVVLEREGALP